MFLGNRDTLDSFALSYGAMSAWFVWRMRLVLSADDVNDWFAVE
jgi:hypothetical protein